MSYTCLIDVSWRQFIDFRNQWEYILRMKATEFRKLIVDTAERQLALENYEVSDRGKDW